jgi:hypothetical protein
MLPKTAYVIMKGRAGKPSRLAVATGITFYRGALARLAKVRRKAQRNLVPPKTRSL